MVSSPLLAQPWPQRPIQKGLLCMREQDAWSQTSLGAMNFADALAARDVSAFYEILAPHYAQVCT